MKQIQFYTVLEFELKNKVLNKKYLPEVISKLMKVFCTNRCFKLLSSMNAINSVLVVFNF